MRDLLLNQYQILLNTDRIIAVPLVQFENSYHGLYGSLKLHAMVSFSNIGTRVMFEKVDY